MRARLDKLSRPGSPPARQVRVTLCAALLACACGSIETVGEHSTARPARAATEYDAASPTTARRDTRRDSEHASGEERPSRGAFTIGIDNDIVFLKDEGYTAGGYLEWTTGELSGLSEANTFNQLKRWGAFLPHMDDSDYRHYASVSFNYEMYTPTDLSANPPPPDQQPYAGVMAVDAGLYARSEKGMHAYGVRLGIVGPATGAAQVQRWLHEKMGSEPPLGWSHQLSNEPLLNVYYRYQERLLRRVSSGGLGLDLMGDVGGGLGNYYTGAAASGLMRVGYNVPSYHSVNLVPTTRQVMIGLGPGAERSLSMFMSIYLQGMATLRFLPTDGNTFTESASVDRDPFTADLTSGFYVLYRHLMLAAEAHNWSDMFTDDLNRNREYGTLRISWIL